MRYSRRLTFARLQTIYERQDNPTWGSDYRPSIRAVRGEAPRISNAFIAQSAKFGREIHLLSVPEQSAFVLAAYHPDVVGIQEQRMLSPEPRVHPLSNFPGEIPSGRASFRGVIDVAERLPDATGKRPTCERILPTFVLLPLYAMSSCGTVNNAPACVGPFEKPRTITLGEVFPQANGFAVILQFPWVRLVLSNLMVLSGKHNEQLIRPASGK